MEKLVFIANPFRLSPDQLRSVAGMSRDIAQVLFAGLVIGPIAVNSIDELTIVRRLEV